MAEYDLNVSRYNSSENIAEKNEDISSTIEEIIKKVEHQKLEKETYVCEGTDDSEIYQSKDNTLNSSNSDSIADKSKNQRSGSRKVRVRHNKKRKWKPYSKLTFEERKKLEERETRRAYLSRERMSASGLTLAPYNTTQFLMDDHNLQEPDYESIHNDKLSKEDCHSYDSEEDFYSSPDDEDEFMNQQFTETYDSLRDAYLHSMSKFELVTEILRLEDEVEGVELSVKECKEKKQDKLSEYPNLDVEAELAKIQVFQVEIEKLTQENFMLEKKNKSLQNRISKLKTV